MASYPVFSGRAEELNSIIKLARDNGVSRLTCGDISLEFSVIGPPSTAPAPDIENLRAEIAVSTKKSLIEDTRSAMADELSELLLTNPTEFEKRLRKGEIENANEEDFAD